MAERNVAHVIEDNDLPGAAEAPGFESAAAERTAPGRRRGWLASSLLILALLATGVALAAWKVDTFNRAEAAAAAQPEPVEAVSVATAEAREFRPTATAIGTVLATRSVTLRNELPGTVSRVTMVPGQVVAAGTVLVRLDVSVEEAELAAQEAQAALAQTILERNQQASVNRAVSELEVDRARAERDVALAQIARTRAIIERKTIRAPFRARVGLADVHPGQYLDEGTVLTTLQGIADAAHVDFSVAQAVAAGLDEGDRVRVAVAGRPAPIEGTIVAIDSRVDPTTRNAAVRARIADADGPSPGASVRVEVPEGPAHSAVAIPVSALRKGPAGDHVFVIAADPNGQARAHLRPVQSGTVLDGEVLILDGLRAGEQVAASGSFKLREAAAVAIAGGALAAIEESR